MNDFDALPGLDALVARMIAPRVDEIADQVLGEAQKRAPGAKSWVTVGDDLVRHTHRAMEPAGGGRSDGSLHVVPDNLRFQVPRPNAGNDANDVRGGFELADAPGDDALSPANRINCRCHTMQDPTALARATTKTPTHVVGTRVSSRVECAFHRVAESEFPDQQDGGGGWMRGAAREVAAKHRR